LFVPPITRQPAASSVLDWKCCSPSVSEAAAAVAHNAARIRMSPLT